MVSSQWCSNWWKRYEGESYNRYCSRGDSLPVSLTTAHFTEHITPRTAINCNGSTSRNVTPIRMRSLTTQCSAFQPHSDERATQAFQRSLSCTNTTDDASSTLTLTNPERGQDGSSLENTRHSYLTIDESTSENAHRIPTSEEETSTMSGSKEDGNGNRLSRLSIFQWNCQGIRNKIHQLTAAARMGKYDILILQETLLPDEFLITVRGHKPFHLPIPAGGPRELSILVRTCIPTSFVPVNCWGRVEVSAVEIHP